MPKWCGGHVASNEAARSHAAPELFGAYLQRLRASPYTRRCLLPARRCFVERYPDLKQWFGYTLGAPCWTSGPTPPGAIMTSLLT
jgi:hypothetical protein